MWSELGLRGVAVLVDHSRYDGFSADGSQFGHVPYGLRVNIWGPLSPGLVRPVAVVMEQVLAEHRGQVPFTDDQDSVQQFAAESPDDAFADGVHPWRPWQGGDDPQPLGLEHLTERRSEERIAIMNEELQRADPILVRGTRISASMTSLTRSD